MEGSVKLVSSIAKIKVLLPPNVLLVLSILLKTSVKEFPSESEV